MNKINKPRVIKDYEKLPEAVLAQIKEAYPYSFEKHLIQFTNAKGEIVSALPYEGEEFYYLIRMTKKEALQIIEDDDDDEDDNTDIEENASIEEYDESSDLD